MVAVNTPHDEVSHVPSTASSGSNDGAVPEKVTAVEVSAFDMHDEFTDTASEEANVFKTNRKDARDMQRMGKDQQLVRHFRLLSMASFLGLATAAWELGLFVIEPALTNGGPPSLLYSMIWNFSLFCPVFLSLAEMASMAPTAGAQYHWVSEFAPENCQRILSYLTGWLSTIAWQAGNALGALLVGTLIQTIIGIANPDYLAPRWQGTLLTFGAVGISFALVVWGNKAMPHWQNAVFAIHVLTYFAVIIPIWVNAPVTTHSMVWTEFTNEGGWSTTALAVLAGQLTAISGQVGIDSGVHMAEEVKNAAKSIPKSMMAIYVINFLLIFPAFVTVCYHIPSLDDALADPSGYAAVYVLRQSMSDGWLMALLAVTCLLLEAGNVVYLTAVTRDLFAFGRDRGLPFASWVAKVDRKSHVPINATILSSVFAIVLSLIYIGNDVAFYAMTSLFTVALLACYIISIACCLWRRITYPETMPPAQFSLGRLGIPFNIFAIVYSLWSFFWCFWPTTAQVDASSFNWASAIFGIVMLLSLVYFFVRARHHYVGPVVYVEGRNLRRGQAAH